jgi:hypothetical protein
MSEPTGGSGGWLDEPRNVNKLLWALYVACGLLVVADFLIHKHPHFGADGWPAFYAFYGFLAFFIIVLLGKQFRKLIMRPPGYYDGEADDE